MPSTYEPIATQTLGSVATDITFSSIASSWTDLRISLTGTLVSLNQPFLRFNGDTATNYSSTNVSGNGTSAASSRATGANRMYFALPANTSDTIPSFYAIDIFSYAGSTNKTCLINCSLDENGSGFTLSSVGLWRSTSAITSVTLSSNATNNWKAGTTATLYGIKNA